MNTATHSNVRATSTIPNATQDSPHLFHSAYDATAADRAAVSASELFPLNLDIQVVTTTVLGALPRLKALRADIVATVPDFDMAQFDKIEIYAKALAYAQTVYLATSTSTEALPALAARAMEIRAQLLSDATALARRGLLDRKRLDELKGGTGYLNVASDVGVLVHMLRERWTDIASKSAIQPAELDEAEQVFERITLAYAERSRQSIATVAAGEDRQRAYTLLVNAYDQARRVAEFLRWAHEDADKFAPSLWAGRGGRGASASEPGKGKEPDHSDVTASAQPKPATVPPPEAEPTMPGLPGGSPFADG